MGGSGSAWIKHKKQKGLRSAAMTEVPHPTTVRIGQRYFRLDANARSRATVQVTRIADDYCHARREGAEQRTVRLSVERLLATDAHGQGRYYRFLGYAPRASYGTHAVVADADDHWAQIVCPEWHPGLTITIAAAALPPDRRAPGTWVACKANLGAVAPARVSPHSFSAPAGGFDPSRLHAVALDQLRDDAAASRDRDDAALSCDRARDDVVLFVATSTLAETGRTSQAIYLTGHPPATRPGARAYLYADGRVAGWRRVIGLRPCPNGTRVLLDGPWHPIELGRRLVAPVSVVANGAYGIQRWTQPPWERDSLTDRQRKTR